MHHFYPYAVDDIDAFKSKVLLLSNLFEHFCYLDSNNYPNYPHSTFGSLFAIDALETFYVEEHEKDALIKLQTFLNKNRAWVFGFLNYDLKNIIEPELESKNDDSMHHSLIHFFIPKYIIKIEHEKIEIGVTQKADLHIIEKILQKITTKEIREKTSDFSIQHKIDKKKYLEISNQIKHHIQIGDIYELNFCQEFKVENISIDTLNVFQKLNSISKAPFSCYLKNKHNYLMCASPERFLKKQQNTLISQPIKGTRKRELDKKIDAQIKQELFFNEKERSENVMIVDLVRNDMSKIAKKNSVEVEELFGLYTFEQVHQLISTISCTLENNIKFIDIIQAMFPMGSMTGAPKIAALQLIEKYEMTRRGLFSGCVGYITPKGNFDFNVVIRSIFYNEKNKNISIQTGSAITIDADAEKEYDECLLKAEAMFNALKV
jgi:para-aminobenzoate synthetase component 1